MRTYSGECGELLFALHVSLYSTQAAMRCLTWRRDVHHILRVALSLEVRYRAIKAAIAGIWR